MASDTLTRVRALVGEGKVRVSDHGYDELVDDDILVIDVLEGVQSAILVEDYPEFRKGPSVLVLQQDAAGRPRLGHSEGSRGTRRCGNGLSTRSKSMVERFHETENLMTRRTLKLIHQGRYAAEVPIELIEDDTGWSPYLSVEDATKLDAVRKALRDGDVAAAAKYGRVFALVPVDG